MAISDVITSARLSAGLTQRELAARAKTAQSLIARIERGQANPTMGTIERLLRAVNCELRVEGAPMAPHDPVVEAYKNDVDRTLLIENLRRTPDRRLRTLREMTSFFAQTRVAGRARRPVRRMDFGRLVRVLADAHVDFIVVGGVAAVLLGTARFTEDLDVVYARSSENLTRLAAALRPLKPYLRGAHLGLPFKWVAATLTAGLNFSLTTTAGDLDLLGEITACGDYNEIRPHALAMPLLGRTISVVGLPWLIRNKRAMYRTQDLETIAELEALQEESRRMGREP